MLMLMLGSALRAALRLLRGSTRLPPADGTTRKIYYQTDGWFALSILLNGFHTKVLLFRDLK